MNGAYERAVEQLQDPDTWCEGAAALVELGERRALVELVRAFELPVEGETLCLIRAMASLGGEAAARELIRSGERLERWVAAELMDIFPSDEHLPFLEEALHDPDETVRDRAAQALEHQRRTPAWEAAMARLQQHG